MFHFNVQTSPSASSSLYGKVDRAHAVVFIDYAHLEGAVELAKYYITGQDFVVDEFEVEYYIIDSPEELEGKYLEYYNLALKDGYMVLFNCYISD